VVALGVVFMAVVGVFAVAGATKLYFERQAAVETLDKCVASISDLAATSGTPEAMQRRLAWLAKAVNDRDYEQAQMAIEGLAQPKLGGAAPILPGEERSGGTPPGKLPSPLEAKELPEGAQRFFADNPELWKAFLGFTQTGFRLREAGLNVDDLRAKREAMVEAARMGQKERFEQLLAEARDLIQGKTGENIPDDIKEQLGRFAQAFGEARRQHKDVRQAAALAERAQRAAQRGNLRGARELIDKAITALKNAKPVRGPARRPERERPERERPERENEPPIGFLRYLAQSLMGVMQAEERDFARVWNSVNTAAGAVREKNAEQVREILNGALRALEGINVRRSRLSQDLNARQEETGVAPARSGERPRRPAREETVREMRGRIGEVLARVREMSDEEFEKYKDQLADQLVEAALDRTRPGLRAPGPGPEPGLELAQRPPTAEERVRGKMESLAEPYLHLKRTGADTEELDGLLQGVRQALAASDYEKAERLADAAQDTMRELLKHQEPTGEPLPPYQEEQDRLEYSRPITEIGGDE